MSAKKNDGIRAGKRLLPPPPGQLFSPSILRALLTALVGAANSWLNTKFNLRVILPDGSQISREIAPVITDFNALVALPIDLSALTTTGGTTGGSSIAAYLFQYDLGDYMMCAPAAVQPNLMPSMSYDADGITGSIALIPLATYRWTPGAHDISLTVGGAAYSAAAGAQTFTVPSGGVSVSLFGTPNTVSGTTLVLILAPIAKPPLLRKSIASELIQAVVHTYTYATAYVPSGTYAGQPFYYTRTNSFTPIGGVLTTQPENVTPDYNLQNRIFAVTSADTGVADMTLQDINVDARAWAAVPTVI